MKTHRIVTATASARRVNWLDLTCGIAPAGLAMRSTSAHFGPQAWMRRFG